MLSVVRNMGKVFDVVKDRSGDISLDIHEYLVRHPASTFFMKMEGQGPDGSGIEDQDVIVIDKAVSPRKGDVVVVVEDGDFKVDFLRDTKQVNSGELTVWGTVVGLVRKFR